MRKRQPGCQHVHGLHDQSCIVGEGKIDDGESGFRFGRLVPQGSFQPVILKRDFAQALGDQMIKAVADQDGPMPAGYTYLGQFVDHDITMDTTDAERESANSASGGIGPTPDWSFETAQGRSPSLDLDSLYGHPNRRDERLFVDGGPRFRIGRTARSQGGGHSGQVLPNDLPRRGDDDPEAFGEIHVMADGKTRRVKSGRRALIADMRNDENLAVAQHHLLWLKFHNAMVDAVRAHSPDSSDGELFLSARQLVTRHYQHIVLNDMLRRMIKKEVHEEIIQGRKRSFFLFGPAEVPFMPLEFSVAAYRLGHSMVREAYEWNLNFKSGGTLLKSPANFSFLFRFSGLSGTLPLNPSDPRKAGEALPSNWVADFRQLYDLGGYKPAHLAGATPVDKPNFAKRLDPYLAPALNFLPEHGKNLAFLNLRRGALRGLPSGQDAAKAIPGAKAMSRTVMKNAFAGDEAFDSIMERHGFYERTPLWLYILIEAAATEDGNNLGELGSRILAETFLTLAICSRISIFAGDEVWSPADAEAITRPDAAINDMAGLLQWVDRATPVVSPLEDSRNAAAS